MNKHQIPNTNDQIITNIPMTETFPSPLGGEGRVRGVWVLDNWNLFGAWNLVIGISYDST
jgi:hypothetical protein